MILLKFRRLVNKIKISKNILKNYNVPIGAVAIGNVATKLH